MVFLRWILNILLLSFGMSVIYFHEEILSELEKAFGEKDPRPIVASVSKPKGKVRFKLPKTLVYKKAKDGLELRLKDTITTDSESELKITFKDGLELAVGENSFIVLDSPSEGTGQGLKISFLRGNFKVLKKGRVGKNTLIKKSATGSLKDDIVIDPAAKASLKPIVISAKQTDVFKKLLKEKQNILSNSPKDSETGLNPLEEAKKIDKINASGNEASKLKTRKLSKKEQRERIKKVQFKPREEKETLAETYIVNIIKRQKPFFNRCYAQHIRLNPEAQGRIDFSFTINPKGKVIDVRVLRASINDPRLQQCSMSVIERSQFKAFNGDPIVVNYPIYFE